ncbi:MAG TPA: nuclear transport factor 2 family protein [Thermoleophilaceae bacterium]
MTRDPVDILQRGYELMWLEGDFDRAVGGLGEDFEWFVPGVPGGEMRRGPEGTKDFFREWLEPWEDHRIEWEIRRAGDDRVVVLSVMHARGRASGAEVEMHLGQVWTFSGGRAVRMVAYNSHEEALAAAGLAP